MTKKFEELAEEVESSLSQLSACSDSGSLHATIEHLRTVLVSLRYDVDNGNYEGEECDALRQQLLGELEELVKGIAPILQALLGVLGDASNLDRDYNGARGIFLLAHTRQLTPYSDPNVTVGTD